MRDSLGLKVSRSPDVPEPGTHASTWNVCWQDRKMWQVRGAGFARRGTKAEILPGLQPMRVCQKPDPGVPDGAAPLGWEGQGGPYSQALLMKKRTIDGRTTTKLHLLERGLLNRTFYEHNDY